MPVNRGPFRTARILTAAVAALGLAACEQTPTAPTAHEAHEESPDGTAAAAADLRVCLPENDPPRSQRGLGGLDADIAAELAAALGRRLTFVWLPEEEQTDIESTDIDFRPLLMGQCDLQLSVPSGAGERYRRWLVLSEPYYGAGFELIPGDSAFRFENAFPGTVAVRANTVAHLALNAAGVDWSQQSSNADVVEAVAAGCASAGLVWGPQLALLDVDPSADFQAPPVLRWNLHAALRRDNALREQVDRLFAGAEFQAKVRESLAAHGIPIRGPFESAHTTVDLLAL